ncbi:MAG: hypothetical protein ACOH2A_02250 [Sphingobacteriaceae bacterium]
MLYARGAKNSMVGQCALRKMVNFICILIGLLLLGKGIAFVSDIASMQELLTANNPLHFSAVTIIFINHIVAFVHLLFGGI